MSVDLSGRLAALDAWLATHAPETHSALNASASNDALDAFERHVGFTLPADFRTLYRWHDGQAESMDTTEAGVFGLPFIPLADGQAEWDVWHAMLTNNPELHETMPGQVSHPPGHIREQYITPGWVPFTKDSGGNSVGIDLDPGPLGTPGQVISFGRDENEKYVLSRSLAAFVDEFVRRLEQGRVRVYQPDDDGFALELQAASGEFMDGYSVLADLFPGFGASPTP